MKQKQYTMQSEMWLYPSETAAWHFITLDKDISQEIKKKHGINSRGFGSLPVEVTIGKTSWNTSIFPDKKYGAYVLPVKSEVRRKEGIFHGDSITFTVNVR